VPLRASSASPLTTKIDSHAEIIQEKAKRFWRTNLVSRKKIEEKSLGVALTALATTQLK